MKRDIFYSVIIPVFNSSKTINKVLGQLAKQSSKNFETIIIDDESQDNTLEIIKKFKEKNNSFEIKIFSQTHFGGPAKGRNLGIKNCKGNWIFFLDSDDFWFRNKIKIIDDFLKFQKNSLNYDAVVNDEVFFLNGKRKYLSYGPFVKKNFYHHLLFHGNSISTSAICLKKEFLLKNSLIFSEKKNLISVEDFDLWLKMAQKKAKFKFIKKYLGIYNFNDQSISSKRIMHLNNTLYLYDTHLKKLNLLKGFFYKLKIRIFVLYNFIKISFKERNFKLLFFAIRKIFC